MRNDFGEFHHLFVQLRAGESKFREYFRMSLQQFDQLLSIIEKDIEKQKTNYRERISARERLAVCLRYLATGNSFRSMAFTYRMGRATVSNIVEDVCDAIWKNLQPIVMPEPNADIWKAAESVFQEKWNFPHCVAAIDGKHVRIKAPPAQGSQFFNYKKYHSIVLLALVDGNKRFLSIDVGQYGRVSDGNVFMNSSMGKRLTRQTFGLPPDEDLVADEAFPLKRFLMRPYPRSARRLSESERIFNYRLSRSRNTVENAFGILASVWRIYQTPLECRIDLAEKIILATVVLHNYIHETPTQGKPGVVNEEAQDNSLVPLHVAAATNATRDAIQIRNFFTNYFTSNEGQVPWQERVVNRIN
nr:unnamed protein product [Callosobruchus analis]